MTIVSTTFNLNETEKYILNDFIKDFILDVSPNEYNHLEPENKKEFYLNYVNNYLKFGFDNTNDANIIKTLKSNYIDKI